MLGTAFSCSRRPTPGTYNPGMASSSPADEVLAGNSPGVDRLREQIARVARTPLTTVLLVGELGSQPERIARVVHESSTVADGPFHAARCDAFAAKGPVSPSFDEDCPLLASASGGTLFLEEVSALGPEAQGRLHGYLERRAAGTSRIELRVVASTRSDLEALSAQGRFREDLLYRLNVLTLRLPPLRERAEDLPELAGRMLRRLGRSLGDSPGLTEAAAATLTEHDWPGNLVELEAVLQLALLRAEGEVIETEHLALGGEATDPEGDQELIPLPSGKRSLRAVEEAMIRRVLVEEGGNRSKTARVLGINRTTLYNKLRLYDIR